MNLDIFIDHEKISHQAARVKIGYQF